MEKYPVPNFKSDHRLWKCTRSYNFGLFFNKFSPFFSANGKIQFSVSMAIARSGACSCEPSWADVTRQEDLVKAMNGRTVRLEVAAGSRLAAGMGNPHPTENGLQWHPITGLPFIPGSSIKGVTQAWAIENGYEKDADEVFGTPEQVGRVIFFDALPSGKLTLQVDVMTPHFSGYYAGTTPFPDDTEDPRPIEFLAVGSGSEFAFGIAPLDGLCCEANKDLMGKVEGWLRAALEENGVGAKTSVGYGLFSRKESSATSDG